MEPLLHRLQANPELTRNELQNIPDKGGYVFYEDDKPIYVGRSNNIRNRIKGHVAPNAGATFAFKLLRENTGIQAGYSQETSKNALLKRYAEGFKEQRDRVRKMTFRVVETDDQRVQYIFEVYAIFALGTTRYNTFDTT